MFISWTQVLTLFNSFGLWFTKLKTWFNTVFLWHFSSTLFNWCYSEKQKKHRLPNKKQLLSAIYKYKYVFITIVSHYETKISPQILATNKNKTSSISVEQTTISISRFFLYWICEKIRSVAACPFFGHDGSTEYNGHIFQLCHTLVEVPLFDGVQKAANTSACHVFTGTSSRNNKSSKLGEADHLPQIGCTSSSF